MAEQAAVVQVVFYQELLALQQAPHTTLLLAVAAVDQVQQLLEAAAVLAVPLSV